MSTQVTELALTQVNITTLGGGWGGDIEDFFGAPDPFVLADLREASTPRHMRTGMNTNPRRVQHSTRYGNDLQHCFLRR